MAAQKDNLLLAALPAEERKRLEPFLKWTATVFEDPLVEPGEPDGVFERPCRDLATEMTRSV